MDYNICGKVESGMGYKIGICDDNQVDMDYVTSLVKAWAEQEQVGVECKTFPSAESFLFQYEDEQDYDILLLDIEMGQLSGMDLAREIRQKDSTVQIVFITGYPDYMSQGYDVTALHYLMKPVRGEKLGEVLTKAVSFLAKQPRSIIFDMGKESLRLLAEDIFYGEAQGHYIVLYTKSGEHRIRMNISELENKLGEGFYKCSRSFVVGLKYVRRITKTMVVLELQQNLELPLGKGLYDDMNRALIHYLRGR